MQDLEADLFRVQADLKRVSEAVRQSASAITAMEGAVGTRQEQLRAAKSKTQALIHATQAMLPFMFRGPEPEMCAVASLPVPACECDAFLTIFSSPCLGPLFSAAPRQTAQPGGRRL